MKKRIISIVIASLMAFSMTACGSSDESSKDTTTKATGTTTTAPIDDTTENMITDREGNEIEIPVELNKIISVGAANTEILVGLGLSEKIVMADQYSYDVEGIDASICTIDMMNTDVESLIALEADVIFITGMTSTGANDPYNALKEAGVAVVYIPTAVSLQGIMDDITFISKYTKTEEKGTELVTSIQTTIDEVKMKVGLLSSNPPSVYIEISPAPYMYTTGAGTFIDEMITIAGGINIYVKENSWISNTEETVLAANPEIILSTSSYEGYDYKEISDRAGWEAVSAVANNKVILVNSNAVQRASQNISKGLMEIAKAIHPSSYE